MVELRAVEYARLFPKIIAVLSQTPAVENQITPNKSTESPALASSSTVSSKKSSHDSSNSVASPSPNEASHTKDEEEFFEQMAYEALLSGSDHYIESEGADVVEAYEQFLKDQNS